MNIVEIKYQVREAEGHTFHSSKDVYEGLKGCFNPIQEEFYLLPSVGQQFTIERLFVGALDASTVDPKTIFHKLLVKYPNCKHFLIAHNHPSGVTEPSGSDKVITEGINKAADLLGFHLYDHIIFSNQGYYSFADSGNL